MGVDGAWWFWEDPTAKPYYDLAGDVLIDYYKPISKHWSFKKQEGSSCQIWKIPETSVVDGYSSMRCGQ